MKHALLIVTAVAFAAAAGGCAWLVSRYAPGYSVAQMFMNADIIAKLVIMLVLPLTFGALLLGVIGLFVRGPAGSIRMLLMLTAAASAGLGLLAALYGWMNIQTAIRAIGAVSFAVTAPSWAETLLALSFGLFGALVALGFRALAGRRG
jgi:hypothetical protein